MSKRFWEGFWMGLNPLYWLAWGLFWMGDLANRIGNRLDTERSAAICSPIYQWCMRKSLALQDFFGFDGPWKPAPKVEEKDR